MPGWSDAFSGGGVTGTGQSSQSTYFGSNPIANPLASLSQEAAAQYMDFIRNPTSHPLYQAQIGGLLQSLVPSENRARTSLTDMFRASGGLRSGAYGREATMLEGELMGRRNQAASQLLGQAFGQVTGALNNPISQIPNLLQALKLSQGFGQQPGMGGSWGVSGGSSFLDQPWSLGPASGANPANPYSPWYTGGGGATTTGGATYQDLLSALSGGMRAVAPGSTPTGATYFPAGPTGYGPSWGGNWGTWDQDII